MPRKPWSETMSLVPPPITMVGRPLARATVSAAMKASALAVSAYRSAGPPMPNRVYRDSGVSRETVKLGISARRACVSSVVGINSIIRGGIFMRSGFPGFPPEGIQFLRSLARHNQREWFQPRKPIFDEKVKQPMRQLVEAVNGALAGFAPEYVTDPEKAIC